MTKTLAFHTNLNYEISAPEPFTQDVHEDLLADLARINSTNYASDFDLHIDISQSVKRLQDGHCVYTNACYDSSWLTFIPLPLALLTDEHGNQAVHITPEAFAVASAQFGDDIEFWQNALPGSLKGQLESVRHLIVHIQTLLQFECLVIWCRSLRNQRRRPLQRRKC